MPVCSGISSAISRYRNFVCLLLAILRMVSIGYCPVYGGSITYFQFDGVAERSWSDVELETEVLTVRPSKLNS